MSHPTYTSGANVPSTRMASGAIDVCAGCAPVGLERTRYFARQLVGPDDLTQDQLYFREKLRRHNRLLHGWGIVCGARVRRESDCEAVVEAGYLLGPWGDEIVIPQQVTVDVCHEDLDGNAVSPCSDAKDPWCSDVHVDRGANARVFIAVRHAECRTRPVRSSPGGCGCDETACEYSRTRDAFAIKVLPRLPSTYAESMTSPAFEDVVFGCDGRACPPCPTEPWVILADVVLDGNGHIAQIDCPPHRRYVASFANFYFTCEPPPAAATFRVASLKVLGLKSSPNDPNPAVLYDSAGGGTYPPSVELAKKPSTIDVSFTGGTVDIVRLKKGGFEIRGSSDKNPATASNFFTVPGTVTDIGNNAARWTAKKSLEEGSYVVTLRGSGTTPVVSTQQARLDGELQSTGVAYYSAVMFPSGEGIEGGDAKFAFVVVRPTTTPVVKLAALTLSPVELTRDTGSDTSTATISLTGNAPLGGMVIPLSSNHSNVTIPANVTLPAGATEATVTATASWANLIADKTSVTITARDSSGTTKTAQLDLKIIG